MRGSKGKTLSRSYGRGGAHRAAVGGEGLYAGLSKTLTSQAFGLGPSSPAKSGRGLVGATLALLLAACATAPSTPTYDVVIRGGTIYDGSGGAPYNGDVAIAGDRIAYVGPRLDGGARTEIDASGLAVAPGFINMLSWANETLIADAARPERHPPGRHPRGDGRGRVDGPVERRR